MNRKRLLFCICLALSASGCLSIVPGALETELNAVRMEPGILVEVIHDGTTIATHKTPAQFRVRTASGIILRFSKPGYYPVSVRTYAFLEPDRFLQSCFFSMPTLFTGALWDSHTGANQQLMPHVFDFALIPLPGTALRKTIRVAVRQDEDSYTVDTVAEN